MSNQDFLYSEAVASLSVFIDKMNENVAGSDQRALTIAGIYIAIATAILGALAASTLTGGTVVSAVAVAIVFYIGAALSLASAMPRLFHISATSANVWQYYIDEDADELEVKMAMFGQLQEKIETNEVIILKNGKLFRFGAWMGIFAPIVGAIIYVFSFACQLACQT